MKNGGYREKGKSAAQDWLRAHVNYQGDDCLEWPFSRSRGYGQVAINRVVKKAPRVMCEMAHGAPPAPGLEAAHSCGNGHLGCINPRHLSWKTRTENRRDRTAHGRTARGEFGKSKLLPDQVREIRRLGDTVSKEELGRRYKVSPSTIGKIIRFERWKTYDGYLRRHCAVAANAANKRRHEQKKHQLEQNQRGWAS